MRPCVVRVWRRVPLSRSRASRARQVTFPALTGLQVERTRVEGAVLVVELRPCVSSAITAASSMRLSDAAWAAFTSGAGVVAGALDVTDTISRHVSRGISSVNKQFAARVVQASARGMLGRKQVRSKQPAWQQVY